ncbi:MAG: hypothetical protein HY985_11485 [Magnetospirillum sp.]|nr:hypothetical protein [Magnetospirillum sp.]
MSEVLVDDLRRVVLGLLFVVAFGWMGAQVLPGHDGNESDQVAFSVDVVPPQP